MSDNGREDRDYWNDKYAEASCHEHGDDDMHYDTQAGEWFCGECDLDDEWKQVENYG